MILINGKTSDKLMEDDLFELIDNPDYKENQYIDYKEVFAFWDERLPKDKRNQEAIEFKKDVCSFANAEGGYIFVGISDKNGLPKEICGIEINDNNKDKFELAIRDKLANIQPKMPSVKVHYVDLANGKYVVVLEITADGFAPYVYNSGNDIYDFVSRDGNGKRRMSYNQVMRMFNQALVIQTELEKFRQKRVLFYSKSNQPSLYCRIYVISEDFIDIKVHRKVFMLYQNNRTLITCPSGFTFVSPNVDGIKFLSYRSNFYKEAHLFNSGICELNINLDNYYLHENKNKWCLSGIALWNEQMISHIKYSAEQLSKLGFNKKAYMCFDLSCYEGTITDGDDFKFPQIDRGLILSPIIEIEDISNQDLLNKATKSLGCEYLMALGIRDSDRYNELENQEYF